MRYDEENDCYIADYPVDEYTEKYKGQDYIVNGKVEHLYAIGSHEWCWAMAEQEAFIRGNAVSDIVYRCPFSTDSMTDKAYIQFVLDKEPLIEETANTYINEHQENILAQFYNNALLRKELQKIYDDSGHILHRVKAIIDAVTQGSRL